MNKLELNIVMQKREDKSRAVECSLNGLGNGEDLIILASAAVETVVNNLVGKTDKYCSFAGVQIDAKKLKTSAIRALLDTLQEMLLRDEAGEDLGGKS